MKRQSILVVGSVLFAISPLLYVQVSLGCPTITNGGFETQGIVSGFPSDFGYWGAGDRCEVVGTSDGIVPFEGTRMLHFIYSAGAPHAYWNSCDVWQLVDMTPFQDAVDTGRAVADVSAHFNRVLGDSETDTGFPVVIAAFTGSTSGWVARFESGNYLAYATAELFSDGDTSTWEPLSVNLLIPVGTTFLAVDIAAHENICNDAVAPEFDGHYADAVSMTITVIPVPSAMILGTIGIGFVGWLRRRRTL